MSPGRPSLAQFVRRTARVVAPAAVRNHLLRAPDWAIAVFEGDAPHRLRPHQGVTNPILTGRDVSDVDAAFVADPFALQRDGVWYLFFEVLNRTSGLGEIGLATSEDLRRWTYQRIVLAEPFHLSYPLVFEHDDAVYLVPEAAESGGVRLYRATSFPHEWTLEAVVMTASVALDATVFHHGGHWWMLCDTSRRRTHDTLCLYRAATPVGPWVAHPASPLITGDPAAARPAGRVVRTDGTLIRFAQDCAQRYGQRVRAYEITELTPTAYRERLLDPAVVGPGDRPWNAHAMHHVDAHRVDGRWLAFVDGS